MSDIYIQGESLQVEKKFDYAIIEGINETVESLKPKIIKVQGGSCGASSLSGLSDVELSTPESGQILKYDEVSRKWVNGDQIIAPIIYSTNEREVGVWIDGKPLYEKTIALGSLPDSDIKEVLHGITDLKEVVSFDCYGYNSTNGYSIILPKTSDSSFNYQAGLEVDATKVYIYNRNGTLSSFTGYATLRYTKTTDTPGSGTWTTSGVPTVHYDGNEKIVGTWYGETLYEKSFYATGAFSNGTQYSIDTGVLHDDLREIVELNGNVFSTDVILPLNFYLSSNEYTRMFVAVGTTGQNVSIEIYAKNFNFTKYKITIRYTKTTD